jgi:hypothetical protein
MIRENRRLAGCRRSERMFIRFDGIMIRSESFVKDFFDFFMQTRGPAPSQRGV